MNSFDPANEEAYYTADLTRKNKSMNTAALGYLYEQKESIEALLIGVEDLRVCHEHTMQEIDLLEIYDEFMCSVEACLMMVNEQIEERRDMING